MENVVKMWMGLLRDGPEAVLDQLWQLDGRFHKGCNGPVEQRFECGDCGTVDANTMNFSGGMTHTCGSKAWSRWYCHGCATYLPHEAWYEVDPPPGPEVVLYGQAEAERRYVTDTAFQRACDLWDMGRVNKWDIKAWCEWLSDDR